MTCSPQKSSASSPAREPLLEVRGLRVHFETERGVARAVDGVDLTLFRGERFGLVGESGSGKSTLLLSLLRMIRPPGRIVDGVARLADTDLLQLGEEEMRQMRLKRVAMIPQGAMSSLNPVMRVGEQIRLAMTAHVDESIDDEQIGDLLDRVGLATSAARLYPHELSGGMKQRVCIAIAISLSPQLILADEPTSALDVVVQRRILQILSSLQAELGATVLLVGHDMGLMAQSVERLGIMYGGQIVEVGTVEEIFAAPRHPYTRLLIDSIPRFGERGNFRPIPGVPMSLLQPPTGCYFHPRCPDVMERCRVLAPASTEKEEGHHVSCWLHSPESVDV